MILIEKSEPETVFDWTTTVPRSRSCIYGVCVWMSLFEINADRAFAAQLVARC